MKQMEKDITNKWRSNRPSDPWEGKDGGGGGQTVNKTEMEFLEISLINDSRIFSMLFIVPTTGGFWRKSQYSSLVLKILTENYGETRKLESIHEYHFVEWENEGRKPDKNSSVRRLEFMLTYLN